MCPSEADALDPNSIMYSPPYVDELSDLDIECLYLQDEDEGLQYSYPNTPGLTVSITGPSYVEVPDKYEGSIDRTWSVNLNGNPCDPHDYEWYRIVGACTTLVCTTASYTKTYTFDGYIPDVNVTLLVEVTDDDIPSYSDTDTHSVYEDHVPHEN